MDMTTRAAWLEERRKGIGGSDVAPICGLSPWVSPYQVYLDKIGEAPEQEDNDPMMWGRLLEPVIRQRYADVTGRTVEVPNEAIVCPEHPFMRVNLDGRCPDRILEVKTARTSQSWGEPGTDRIPDYYALQVQHGMIVTGIGITDIAVLFGGSDFQIYTVHAEPDLQQTIIEAEMEFWIMVQWRTPPEPRSLEDVKARFGGVSKAMEVQANLDVLKWLQALKKIKDERSLEEGIKANIMKHMGEADTLLEGDKILATWKMAKPRKTFDTKTFKEIHPDLHAKYLKEGAPSRRFLPKF